MSDVIVLGAGVIGASIAYHLALRGAGVTLVDATATPAAPSASWASAGGLRSQGRHAAVHPLTRKAAARWATLDQELDVNLEIKRGGHLHLAENDEEARTVEARVAADRAGGVAIELVQGQRLREIVPGLASSAIAGAWTPGDGQANPVLTARAFAAAARRHGARWRGGAHLVPHVTAGRVTALIGANGERLDADQVVLATGAWSVRLLRDLGVAVPLRWRALQMLSSNVAASSLVPTLTAVGRNLSLKQTPDRRYMVGGSWTLDDAGDAPSATPEPALIAPQWIGAVGLLPVLHDLSVERTWAGAEAQTIDALPLIGMSAIQGLYLATGFSNHGFQISPEVGALVANHLAGDGASLEAFRPMRFGDFGGGWRDFVGAPTRTGLQASSPAAASRT